MRAFQRFSSCQSEFFRVFYEEERTVKAGGYIWRIHKSDKDKLFPSDPHAQDTKSGKKLDLTNGDIFDSGGRRKIGKLSKKDFARVRANPKQKRQ